MVRTRFAPSPTGYLHIGGARTALFSWAYARKHQGRFILRIEDTDRERSTPASVQAILDAMAWLGLDYDEGPFYQTQRTARYREVIQRLLDEGNAYYCYASKEELEQMRKEQLAVGLKPRYDRRWRDATATPPAGIKPVIRFKTPLDGAVVIDDLAQGRVVIRNSELDDLIIARADGSPTYNFCVVVDDWDMEISHVIRGNDHLNNTPRQINLLKALGAPIPHYAHIPMILGADGERLSKRHGAVSVTQYRDEGYLPEALLNYLARLGWSHGDEEIFALEQFVDWFHLDGLSKSPAQFNPDKLSWLNQQYLKTADNGRLSQLVTSFLADDCCDSESGPPMEAVVALVKGRVNTLKELADSATYFYRPLDPSPELVARYLTSATLPIMDELADRFAEISWDHVTINGVLKACVATHGMKFPQVAMPLRLLVTGETQTPPVDSVLALVGRDEVLKRMRSQLLKLSKNGS